MQKFIKQIEIKEANSINDIWTKLPLYPGATLEISSDNTVAGRIWKTKITGKLERDVDLLTEPLIVKVRTLESYYIIGSVDIPAFCSSTEVDTIQIAVDYSSAEKPQETKSVL